MNRIAPTYLRRCEEEAAVGRHPPPDYLGGMVDNERQQQDEILRQNLDVIVTNKRKQQGEILHQTWIL